MRKIILLLSIALFAAGCKPKITMTVQGSMKQWESVSLLLEPKHYDNVIINWGDGTSETWLKLEFKLFPVPPSHSYDTGVYTVTASATKGSKIGSASETITIVP